MKIKYTDDELINDLHRFVKENGRSPRRDDMKYSNGYITCAKYINAFGSWSNALDIANIGAYRHIYNGTELCDICKSDSTDHWRYIDKQRVCKKCYTKNFKSNPKKDKLSLEVVSSELDLYENVYSKEPCKLYDDTFLLNELKHFYTQTGRSPTQNDFNDIKYPSVGVYQRRFGSWNNALIKAGLKINSNQRELIGNETCFICNEPTTSHWYYRDGNYICNKCKCGERKYLYGNLNPKSCVGFAVIIEYIVSTTLNDTLWYNGDISKFNYKYDMYNSKYGQIDVKCSYINDLIKYPRWSFCIRYKYKNQTNKLPDNFILVCLNNDKSCIEHIFIIPSDTIFIQNKNNISIRNTQKSLEKYRKFEINSQHFNKILKELNLTDIYHFRNIDSNIKIGEVDG